MTEPRTDREQDIDATARELYHRDTGGEIAAASPADRWEYGQQAATAEGHWPVQPQQGA